MILRAALATLVALVLVGCGDGRRSTAPYDSGVGAATDTGVPPGSDSAAPVPDAASAARCNRDAPFETPELVEVPDEARGDFYFVSSAWLDATETQMIVTARPRFDDGGKLYLRTRADRAEPFGLPVLLPGVDVEGRSEWSGALSPDGLTLFFDVARREPYRATRPSMDAPFTAGERIAPALSTEYRSYVNVRPSSTGVYFVEQTSLSSTLQHLASGDEYPTSVLDHGGSITGYHVSADELTLYYSLTAPSESNAVLHRTARASIAEPFSAGRPFELEPIVSFRGGTHLEWISDDECVLYVTVNAIDSVGSYPHEVLLRAERPR